MASCNDPKTGCGNSVAAMQAAMADPTCAAGATIDSTLPYDIVGFDYGAALSPISACDCLQKCKAEPHCDWISWTTAFNGRCVLKAMPKTNDRLLNMQTMFASGVKPIDGGLTTPPGRSALLVDPPPPANNVNDCFALCQRTANCALVTYGLDSTTNAAKCFLYDSPGSDSQSETMAFASGRVPQPPPKPDTSTVLPTTTSSTASSSAPAVPLDVPTTDSTSGAQSSSDIISSATTTTAFNGGSSGPGGSNSNQAGGGAGGPKAITLGTTSTVSISNINNSTIGGTGSSSSKRSAVVIVASALGSVAFLAIVALVIALLLKRRKRGHGVTQDKKGAFGVHPTPELVFFGRPYEPPPQQEFSSSPMHMPGHSTPPSAAQPVPYSDIDSYGSSSQYEDQDDHMTAPQTQLSNRQVYAVPNAGFQAFDPAMRDRKAPISAPPVDADAFLRKGNAEQRRMEPAAIDAPELPTYGEVGVNALVKIVPSKDKKGGKM